MRVRDLRKLLNDQSIPDDALVWVSIDVSTGESDSGRRAFSDVDAELEWQFEEYPSDSARHEITGVALMLPGYVNAELQ